MIPLRDTQPSSSTPIVTLVLIAMNVMGLGSLLAILGGLVFVVNIGWPLVRRRDGAAG